MRRYCIICFDKMEKPNEIQLSIMHVKFIFLLNKKNISIYRKSNYILSRYYHDDVCFACNMRKPCIRIDLTRGFVYPVPPSAYFTNRHRRFFYRLFFPFRFIGDHGFYVYGKKASRKMASCPNRSYNISNDFYDSQPFSGHTKTAKNEINSSGFFYIFCFKIIHK